MATFRTVKTLNDFTEVKDGATLVAGDFQTIAKLVVPAQQFMTFGAGNIVNGVDDRGILYCKTMDGSTTPAEIKGTVRLVLADANEVKKVVVVEVRSEQVTASKTDANNSYKLAQYPAWAKEDSKLIIEFKPDKTFTFSKANSDYQIPITVKY